MGLTKPKREGDIESWLCADYVNRQSSLFTGCEWINSPLEPSLFSLFLLTFFVDIFWIWCDEEPQMDQQQNQIDRFFSHKKRFKEKRTRRGIKWMRAEFEARFRTFCTTIKSHRWLYVIEVKERFHLFLSRRMPVVRSLIQYYVLHNRFPSRTLTEWIINVTERKWERQRERESER